MTTRLTTGKRTRTSRQLSFDHRLAAYVAASASVGAIGASEAQAVVVSNSTPQPFGINQHVNIDFNSDGQIDYQIDHDRVNIGTDLDYLQIDKNDVSSAENPLPIDNFAVFPTNGTEENSDHEYITNAGAGEQGYYPAALLSGHEIGPLSNEWEVFQEGHGFAGSNKTIRANRLIDEDATQVDTHFGDTTTFVPFGTPGWIGLGGQTGYLGLRIDLNDQGREGLNNGPSQYWYAWIGVKITSEADATGEVTGWGYETEQGVSILAGETAPLPTGDFNADGVVDAADYVAWRKNVNTAEGYQAWRENFGEMLGAGSLVPSDSLSQSVPEPSSLLLGLATGIATFVAFMWRRRRTPQSVLCG